jgi:hypothetical protein
LKILSHDAVIHLLEGVAAPHLLAAQAGLPPPGDDAPADWLRYGVKEGFYLACTVWRNGEAVATVYYSKNDRGMLCINACHSMRPDLDLWNVLELSFRKLAETHGCKTVEYVTRRPGGIRKAVSLGYNICGVVLRRPMNQPTNEQT